MKVIVLLGAPGSGKGTQAGIIEKQYNFQKISTGDMLRAEIDSGSKFGLEIKEIVQAGEYVDDKVIINMIEKAIKETKDLTNGFVLDGFPRTLLQAEALDLMLEKLSFSVTKVLYFEINQEKLVDRISQRFTCKDCGESYNKIYKNTKIQGICDICGGKEFVYRSDDNSETVLTRFDIYKEQTAPLLPYYAKQGKLAKINADKEVSAVTAEINQCLVSDYDNNFLT